MNDRQPEYQRPDTPGITMNFDNTVSIYHRVGPADEFGQAAADLFALVVDAQRQYPDWPRLLFVEIEGHQGAEQGFDPDFFEFQQEFFFSTLAPFVTAFDLPLTGGLVNPEPQRNDLPDELVIQ